MVREAWITPSRSRPKKRLDQAQQKQTQVERSTSMTYTKPEVNPIAPAISAVRSSQAKQQHVVADSMEILATTAAYESDE